MADMSDNKKYNDIGKEIEKAVKNSASTGNWSSVGSVIAKSVETVLDDVGGIVSDKLESLDSASSRGYADGSYTRARQEQLRREQEERNRRLAKEREERAARIEKQRQQKMDLAQRRRQQVQDARLNKAGLPAVIDRNRAVSSTVVTVAGGIGLGVSGIAVLSTVPSIILLGSIGVGTIFGLAGIAVFGTVLSRGVFLNSRMNEAKRIAMLCNDKGYVEIDNVARSTGQSAKKVLRRIKTLLKHGYFPQGRIDDENSTLILTDEVYNQYLATKKAAQKDIIDTSARVVDDDENSDELKQMIAEGTDYINRLHRLNDNIPGEVITNKLSRLEVLLKEIFTRVKEHPEQMSRMHELMDYYLPTMIKLVSAYEEYDKVSEPGKDIVDAKKDIENTLDTINVAFNKLLNNLFKDSVWDVTTDAQVLKTMLAQKGLADNMEGDTK